MIKKYAEQIKKIIGFLITVFAFMFVSKSIWSQWRGLLNINIAMMSKIILAGIPAYFAADIILAIAWKMLLNWFGEDHLDFLKSIKVYGKSQILKYIPGNLLTVPSRHILSLHYGVEHGPLVGAATFEMIGLLAISSSISMFGILFAERENIELSLSGVLIIISLSLASPFILKYILSHKLVSKKLSVFQTMTWGKYTHLVATWLLYSCFFVITGFVLFLIIAVVLGRWDKVPFYTAFSTFALAWLLGTITPGAPAGVGIREAIIIFVLSTYIGEQASILVSLLMRVITMFADIVFYFASIYFEKIFSNIV